MNKLLIYNGARGRTRKIYLSYWYKCNYINYKDIDTVINTAKYICYGDMTGRINCVWEYSTGLNDVVHGLRLSFRDRLRAVEAPTDMID